MKTFIKIVTCNSCGFVASHNFLICPMCGKRRIADPKKPRPKGK